MGLSKRKKYIIHPPKTIEKIIVAAEKAAEVRERMRDEVRPGISTLELDNVAARLIKETGGESAFLGYRGFPGNICISVNEEVVHGIGRSDKIVQYGDIVSFDIGVKFNGAVGDNATTVSVGPPIETVYKLLNSTEKSLAAAIEVCVPGNFINDIGRAIESIVKKNNFGIVRPEIPHFYRRERGVKLRPGMVLAIEPMINMGSHKVKILADKWTVVSADSSLSAHFEHMVLITKNKPRILTWQKNA